MTRADLRSRADSERAVSVLRCRRRHAAVVGFASDSEYLQWFWSIVEEFVKKSARVFRPLFF